MQLIINYIEKELLNQVKKEFNLDLDKIPFNIPPDHKIGDLSSALPLIISQKSKIPLENVGFVFESPIIKKSYVQKGYLNIFINWSEALKLIQNFNLDQFAHKFSGEKILLEHTSVNPNKAMHIGHLRNSILGDTIARILKNFNAEIKIANYIDDTGLQMAETYYGIIKLSENDKLEFDVDWDTLQTKRSFLTEPNLDLKLWEVYTKTNSFLEENKQEYSQIEKIHQNLEKIDNNIAQNIIKIAQKITEEHLVILKQTFGIDFDFHTKESELLDTNIVQKTIDLLKEKNIIQYKNSGENSGCWVLPGQNQLDSKQEKVIIKSNSIITYAGKDIAYQLWKFNYFSDNQNDFNATINVIDDRQSYVQNVVDEVIKKLKIDKKFHHLNYQVVSLSSNTFNEISGQNSDTKIISMKGRKGWAISVNDLVKQLNQKIQNKHSQALINSTIRIYLLRYSISQMIVFDTEEALKIDGETGIYLNYSLARALELNKKISIPSKFNPELLDENSIKLLKSLANIQLAFQSFEVDFDPQAIVRQCFDICQGFNSYYANAPKIIKLAGQEQAHHKYLIETFINQTSFLFDLLGIEKLDKI